MDRPIRSSINVDRPINICHVYGTCQLLHASKMTRTNQRLTRGSWFHVDQSGDTTCQVLPCGMPSRLQNDVDQWAIDTWHMCHVAVWPTPLGTSPGDLGALLDLGGASDTVWSSQSQSEQSCGLDRQKKKKALSRHKKLDSIRKTAETQKSFRHGRFRLGKRGPSDQ